MRLTKARIADLERAITETFPPAPEDGDWYVVAHLDEGWVFGWERNDGEHVAVEWWPEGFETLHALDLEAAGVVVL